MTKKPYMAPVDLSQPALELEQKPAFNAHSCKQALSTKLLTFAILFEIIAVSAGLAIALGSLYEAIQAAPEHTPGLFINAGLGAIPFCPRCHYRGRQDPTDLWLFQCVKRCLEGHHRTDSCRHSRDHLRNRRDGLRTSLHGSSRRS